MGTAKIFAFSIYRLLPRSMKLLIPLACIYHSLSFSPSSKFTDSFQKSRCRHIVELELTHSLSMKRKERLGGWLLQESLNRQRCLWPCGDMKPASAQAKWGELSGERKQLSLYLPLSSNSSSYLREKKSLRISLSPLLESQKVNAGKNLNSI